MGTLIGHRGTANRGWLWPKAAPGSQSPGRYPARLKVTALALAGLAAAVLVLIAAGGPLQLDGISASSVHLKGGAHAEPSFRDNGLTLTASGELAGLGNGDIAVNITALANPIATCTNPSGKNQPPGQNPAPVQVTGSVIIPATDIDKNGNTPFTVTTGAPTTPIPGAPDCPNPQWTEVITDMAFTSAIITVEQPVGFEVFTIECSFSSPTTNGSVPAGRVSCS